MKSFYNQASCVVLTYCDPRVLSRTLETYLLEIS